MAADRVISGDFEGCYVWNSTKGPYIGLDSKNSIMLNKTTVKSYEVLDSSSKKSAVSAVGRAAVGGLLLGPVGLLAGVSAKNKHTHLVAIELYDGHRCLLEIDGPLFKNLMAALF